MRYPSLYRVWNLCILSLTIYFLSLLISSILNLPISSALADTIPPNITINSPTTGYITNNTSLVVSGATEASTPVEVFIDGLTKATTTSDISGNWSLTVSGLMEGSHSLTAKATDLAGNMGTSNMVSFTIDLTAPIISITSPTNLSYTKFSTILGKTEPYLLVNLFIDSTLVTTTADDLGNWSYTPAQLLEGSHSVYAKVTDKAGNTGTSATITFTYDITRPVITNAIEPPEDMTRVYQSVVIKIYINDISFIDTTSTTKPIILVDNGNIVSGSTYYDSVTEYISFVPAFPLSPNRRYIVYIDPALKDKAGNTIHPRNWEFIVMGSTPLSENPHGNYTDNVNTCKNCHSTHRSPGEKLDKPDFPTLAQVDIYCNACHDGTVAPVPNKWLSNNQHNYQVSITGSYQVGACITCHNPHLTWTVNNANSLQDAYYYTHNDPTNPYLPKSSDEQLCEACHDPTIKDDLRVTYEVFKYKKRNTTTGAFIDYKLCLRCHDGTSAVDIATYYKSTSEHNITASDGSSINGALACGDCHETHGSNNLKILKEDLGHNKGQKFQTTNTVWDVATERYFCVGCHNNNTEMYGKAVPFNETISGHEITSIEFCSRCHGGGSVIKAAHGPVKP